MEVAQPKKTPVRVTDLHDKCISVQVWGREEDEKDQKTVKIKLWIQRQTGVPVKNWDGPAVTPEQMETHHMAMVAVWKVREMAEESSSKYHAIYVDSCLKKKGERFSNTETSFI